MLHHVARSELLYSTALDEALPSDDPQQRYLEACRRLDEAAQATFGHGEDAAILYPGLYGSMHMPEQILDDVLTMEGELLAP